MSALNAFVRRVLQRGQTTALVLGALALMGVTLLVGAVAWSGNDRDVVIGKVAPSVTTAPLGAPDLPVTSTTAVDSVTSTTLDPAAPSGPVTAKKAATGGPYPPPIAFATSVTPRNDLVWVLVVGTDARPGEDPRRARADSIHVIGVNPATGGATILGLPRDAWVNIGDGGPGKLGTALSSGGTDLLVSTVRRATGLPVSYYVLTGFAGFSSIVDELGGVNVKVERDMADAGSGAYFAAGWHHFDGADALAFSRNRKGLTDGDIGRTGNQGKLMIAALHKMRGEVADDGGLSRWLNVLIGHVSLDVGPTDLLQLAALARRLDPALVTNVVAPTRPGHIGDQEVLFLTDEAVVLFHDLRPDASVGTSTATTTTSTSTTSTTTSTTTTTTTTTTTPTVPTP